MTNLRRVAVPAYLVAVALVLFTAVDVVLAVWPFQPGQVSWRFGAVGIASRTLVTPLIGVLLAVAVALLLEQRRVLRLFSVLSGLAAVVIMGVLVFFLLDAVQMRNQVDPAATTRFDLASLSILAKCGLSLVAVLAFAVTGWKASRSGGHGRRARAEAAASPGIIQAGGRAITPPGAAPTTQ